MKAITRHRICAVICGIPKWVLLTLDWLLDLVERVFALGICVGVIYSVYRFASGKMSKSDLELVSTMNTNWKILLVLLLPLFFPTVKKLIQEAKKIGSIERGLTGTPGPEEKRGE